MGGILAIETSADTCSVALARDGATPQELHEFAPRRHNQLIFDMLEQLVPGGEFAAQGVDCLAFSAGPGSFTGLRIAASAVQGLAYSKQLPVVAVPTLAVQAQGALRRGVCDASATVLSVLDARVGEIYCAVYSFSEGVAVQQLAPWVSTPASLSLPGAEYIAVGDGMRLQEQFSAQTLARLTSRHDDIAPRALDMLPLAASQRRAGQLLGAADVQPLYVREEIAWKKLAEQGKHP